MANGTVLIKGSTTYNRGQMWNSKETNVWVKEYKEMEADRTVPSMWLPTTSIE